MKKYLVMILGIPTAMSFLACTDLNEEILDETTGKDLVTVENIDNLVAPAYGTLRHLYGRDFVWGLQTITSDECMFPTRGTDWDDGGSWRDLYQHTWTPQSDLIQSTWDQLMTGIARANYSLQIIDKFDKTEKVTVYMAELRFLRALYNYYIIDLYGQMPVRDFTNPDYSVKPDVLTRAEAFDYIVLEINDIMPVLKEKDAVPYGRMNKDIAAMLLAKLYLNREVYTGTAGWIECKSYCETLINSGRYALMSNYWDIFSIDNSNFFDNNGEAIFAVLYDATQDLGYDGNTQFLMNTLHYSQTFGTGYAPWNGAVMPQDFLLRFDTINDLRYRSAVIPKLGTNRGILTGLQRGPDGDTLLDGKIPLVYTIECPIFAARMEGARVLKYEPKVPTEFAGRVDYDFIVWRISDVYLMLSEAKIRLGQNGDAEINAVRNIRGLGNISSATIDDIIKERGFELYWEGHRRQDMIRCGKFLLPHHEKPETTPSARTLFPIPQTAIDAYDDLELLPQNPGY